MEPEEGQELPVPKRQGLDQRPVWDQLLEFYGDHPMLRALLQIPIAFSFGVGSAADMALTSKLEDMRKRRLRTFFDEIGSSKAPLTAEMIDGEDFLHAYIATLKAVTNTRRTEKIQMFARLLLGAAASDQTGSDAFEEYLDILESLSVRELHILLVLKRFEDTHPLQVDEHGELGNDAQRHRRFWEDFQNTVQQELGLNSGELAAMLARLNRTGFYETFTGNFLGYTGGLGYLTPLFDGFVRWLRVKEGNDLQSEAAGQTPSTDQE